MGDAQILINYIQNQLPEVPEWLQNKISNEQTVVASLSDAAGSVGICAHAVQKTQFSREELWEAISNTLGKSDTEMKGLFPETTWSTILPRMLFVYSLMTKLNINEMMWLESNGGSATALLITPSFWDSKDPAIVR